MSTIVEHIRPQQDAWRARCECGWEGPIESELEADARAEGHRDGCEPSLKAELDSLRTQLARATQGSDDAARAWREAEALREENKRLRDGLLLIKHAYPSAFASTKAAAAVERGLLALEGEP